MSGRARLAALGIAATVVIIDQVSKWWIEHTLELHQSVPVIDGVFSLTYVRNAGAAFGLLRSLAPALRGPVFVAISTAAVVVLVLFLRDLPPERTGQRAALAAVLGGAVGNMIDRVRAGEVIDFLDVYWHRYHWPAFNVADSCISVGVAVLLLTALFPRQAGDEP